MASVTMRKYLHREETPGMKGLDDLVEEGIIKLRVWAL